MHTPVRGGSLGCFPKIRKMAQRDGTGWLGWEDSNCRIWRRWDARWPGLDQNGGAIAAQYPVQKGLDFRWQWSVSAAMPIRARLALIGSRPAGAAATVGLRW